jgi:hypothetical protein
MYNPINTWSTSLLHCDSESCFISWIAPCHVYAKLSNKHYTLDCLLYLSLWITLQTLYSWHYQLYIHTCPLQETDYCINLDETSCVQYYTIVNSVSTPCVYHKDANVCTYDTVDCIPYKKYHRTQVIISMLSFLFYSIVVMLHYDVRKKIKEKKQIQTDDHVCCAVTCCSTCGLAQEYREITVQVV